MVNVLFKAILMIIIMLYLIKSKPLTPDVLKYLEKDQETFANYKQNYRELSCKIMTYSKMKHLYESKEIDKYVIQTKDQKGFLDYMEKSYQTHCNSKYEDFNTVK